MLIFCHPLNTSELWRALIDAIDHFLYGPWWSPRCGTIGNDLCVLEVAVLFMQEKPYRLGVSEMALTASQKDITVLIGVWKVAPNNTAGVDGCARGLSATTFLVFLAKPRTDQYSEVACLIKAGRESEFHQDPPCAPRTVTITWKLLWTW